METVILLFLLMMSDERSKETLKNFLNFYRENKDLIATVANVRPSENAEKTADIAQNASEEKENRPREEVGSNAILEEYLRRFSV